MFFSFDGIDGAGKTTQMQLFCEWLRAAGQEVVACRDPGGTALGEAIRDILLKRHDLTIGCTAEMLLYMAARAQLVDEIIRPALEGGRIVVTDRYLLANVVYQGYAGGLDVPAIWQIGQQVTGGLLPDLTFVFDLPPQAAAQRMAREPDRMERRDDDYRQRLRAGFLTEAARQGEKIVVIDAKQPIEQVQADVRKAAQKILKKSG